MKNRIFLTTASAAALILVFFQNCGKNGGFTSLSEDTESSVQQQSFHGPSSLSSDYVTKSWPTIKERLKTTTSIYDQQIVVQPFVEWIAEYNRADMAKEVLDVYALNLKKLTTESELTVYGGATGASGGYAPVPVTRTFQGWVTPGPLGSGIRFENILESSQFLFGVGRLVQELDSSDLRVATWGGVLKDHYLRWVKGIEEDPTKGSFQVRGWGCGGTRYNHNEHVKNLIGDIYNNPYSYCRSITDVDLWVIAGTAQLYQLHIRVPSLNLLTADEATFLKEYLKRAIDLVATRFTPSVVKVEGVEEAGLYFDAGKWRDGTTQAHAGYTGATFPTMEMKGPETLTLDTSHMRRIIPVLEVFMSVKSLVGTAFPSTEQMKKIALQHTYGLFQGDFTQPFFTNYADGTNGWYRVNYNGQEGFGYPPSTMSISWVDGGYCQFAKYEPRVNKICSAVLTRLQGKTAEDLSYQDKLSECYMKDHAIVKCSKMQTTEVNYSVLNFISSLR